MKILSRNLPTRLIVIGFTILTISAANAQTQQHSDNHNMTLLEQLGTQAAPQLKTEHIEVYQNLTQFLIGSPLSEHEKAAIKASIISKFRAYPTALLENAAEMQQTMQQVDQLTNPTEIALVRKGLIAFLRKTTRQLSEAEKPAMVNIINHHVPTTTPQVSSNNQPAGMNNPAASSQQPHDLGNLYMRSKMLQRQHETTMSIIENMD